MVRLIELIDDFKLEQQILNRSPKYIEQCMLRLNKFSKYMIGELQVEDAEDIKSTHIKGYIRYLQQLNTNKAITINNVLASIKVFFNYLIEEGFIDEDDNPMKRIKNLKEEKRIIVTFNDDEVSRILCDIKEETYYNVRDKLILIFLFETGIRVSELCVIGNQDIARKSILIHGKGSKQRVVHITKLMRKYMRKYEQLKKQRFKHKPSDEIEDYYFLDQYAQKLHRSRINKILREHCDNAGVRKEIRCSPHDCRHYFAHKMLKNGLDIYSLSVLMGHYDTQITSKYLRGIEQEEIINLAIKHNTLNNIKHIGEPNHDNRY